MYTSINVRKAGLKIQINWIYLFKNVTKTIYKIYKLIFFSMYLILIFLSPQ